MHALLASCSINLFGIFSGNPTDHQMVLAVKKINFWWTPKFPNWLFRWKQSVYLLRVLGTVKGARGVPKEMTDKKSELCTSLRRGEYFLLHKKNMSTVLWRDSNALCLLWSLPHVVDQSTIASRRVKLNNGKSLSRIFPAPLIVRLYNILFNGIDKNDRRSIINANFPTFQTFTSKNNLFLGALSSTEQSPPSSGGTLSVSYFSYFNYNAHACISTPPSPNQSS